MAMAQLASTSAAPSAGAGNVPERKSQVQALLAQFDAQINQMVDYPAKDIINALTMLAERKQFAPEIVSFLETKIHRVAPNCKLPIFYLTDSILKNVQGPYLPLFAGKIVPLYCNCVRQVSGKDLRRFIHVLNTWETTRLFNKESITQMRGAANRAMEQADPSLRSTHASFSQDKSSQPQPRASSASSSAKLAQQQQDMELRSLLTKLQNDMGIHPTEHMSLEEVRTNNADYYNQLLEFQAASKVKQVAGVTAQGPGPATGSVPPRQQPPPQQPPVARDPRRPSPARDPRATASRVRTTKPEQVAPPPAQVPRAAPPRARPVDNKSTANDASAAKSSNVAHLMQLLKRKQRVPSPPNQEPVEITNDPPRAPDAAAVMSILQKLKGMSNGGTPSGNAPPQAQPQQKQQQQQRPEDSQQAPPRNDNASRMWFSDKVVAHKDRVESNVQKLYAALPLVCRESGLRFREQPQLDAHLDFLFQYNRARKERGKGGVSRSWYPNEDQWVADFSGDTAPRESTSSSFFDRTQKENEKNAGEQAAWENAHVPVDEAVTRCRICGENFKKSWDEEEEDWMYNNAVAATIHNTGPNGDQQQETIFHKYCYDTVMTNSKQITPAHLIPAERDVAMKPVDSDDSMNGGGLKRPLEEDDSDSDGDDDVKRVKTD